MTDANNDNAAKVPVGRNQRRLWLLQMALVGGCLGLLVSLGIAFALRSSRPALSRERWADAKALWSSAAPASYEIETEVRGAQPAVYKVVVSNGQPVSATRNDIPIKRHRSWETWSVPGMFDTLASDLETLAERGDQLVVRAEFDPKYGYPAKYERIELGTGLQVTWEVKRFEVLSEPPAVAPMKP